MKILIVMIRWKGGVGRVVSSIKSLLEERGHKVEVISREDDLKCYSLKESIFKLRKEVKERDYDILYVMDWSCALPLITKKNMFLGLMGIETKNPILQKIVTSIKGKKAISISSELKRLYPKSNLNYLGIDLKEFKDLKIERIPNSVGFVNWHNENYNYKEIRRTIERLNLKFIESNMNLSKEELVNLYNSVETFISLPKSFAGFNQSWIEAMACGVPRIIGNNNGVGEMLNMNHVEDFKDIEDVLKNSKQIDYKIPKEFNWNFHTNKLIEAFNEKSA